MMETETISKMFDMAGCPRRFIAYSLFGRFRFYVKHGAINGALVLVTASKRMILQAKRRNISLHYIFITFVMLRMAVLQTYI
jgi:hypothetical protein